MICFDWALAIYEGFVQRDPSVVTINDLQKDFFVESALVAGRKMTLADFSPKDSCSENELEEVYPKELTCADPQERRNFFHQETSFLKMRLEAREVDGCCSGKEAVEGPGDGEDGTIRALGLSRQGRRNRAGRGSETRERKGCEERWSSCSAGGIACSVRSLNKSFHRPGNQHLHVIQLSCLSNLDKIRCSFWTLRASPTVTSRSMEASCTQTEIICYSNL